MKQEKALAILKSGKNAFLTGAAGTGKTYVLNQYITFLKERKIPVAITASTGIAATHMNGMTIHSWAGFGIKDRLTRANLVNLKTKKYLKKHLEEARVLIIDEISMLHKSQLEMVDQVLCFFKENDAPFGGIQVIVCGDFFQLPPIGKYSEKSKDKFVFMSPVWVDAHFQICYLTEQYRQEGDGVLNTILNEIRSSDISKNSIDILKEAEKNQLKETITPTKLFTHNVDVDTINNAELNKLKNKARRFKASSKGNKKLVETLKKSVLAQENLELKIDAKVMFVRNNPEKEYVNGTLGTVVDFNMEGFPIVETLQKKQIVVKQETWGIQDDFGKVLASLDQIPLRLAWAITVHKCQGMTLDAAEIDLSKTFEKGQGYVALSRLKNIKNLQLSGFNQIALMVDSLAFKADQRFIELSKIADEEHNLQTLKKEEKLFIELCGGLTDEEEIKKQAKKIKGTKLKKQSTFSITHDYLNKKIPLEIVAEERGLSLNTIMGHLVRIRKDHPDLDLDFYKPSDKLQQKVQKAIAVLDGDTSSLKQIFETLEGKIDYDDIKLALAYL